MDKDKVEKLKVGEKEYTPDEITKLETSVKELGTKAQTLEQKATSLKVVEDFAAKYSLDPAGLVENADGAFTLVNRLIEEGVIDASGKVLSKAPKDKGKPNDKPPLDDDDDLDALLKGDDKPSRGKAEKLEAIIHRALSPLSKGLEELTTVQTGMLRDRWEQKIKERYPNLESDDVSGIFAAASRDKKHGLLEIAEAVSRSKTLKETELRAAHAREFGINLEDFDRNKIDEKSSKGGAAAFAQGKQFSLSKRRIQDNKNLVNPADATREYLKKIGAIR
jgi:hypothetical protein